MKLILCLIACACLCACAGAPVFPCPSGDQPLSKISNQESVEKAVSALIETCLPPKGKGMMVLCDQIYIERLVQAINGNEVPK